MSDRIKLLLRVTVVTITGLGILTATFGAASLVRADTGFVEPDVQVLWTVHGESIGDGFGWNSENLGDINNDGVDDVIVTAPFRNEGGTLNGKIYVYSGKDGQLLDSEVGEDYNLFGYLASTAGDVNNDGVPDYAAGGPGFSGAPEPFKGRAVVYSGKNHQVLLEIDGAAGERFGASITGTGDLNGDGYGDVIVGAPFASGAFIRNGRAYVYSGKDSSIIWTFDGLGENDRLGTAVGRVGDLNNDSVPDLVVGAAGAPGAGNGTPGGGRAYVLSGVDGSLIFTLKPSGTAINFGLFFASGAGDVNGDGLPDIFVADYNDRRGNVVGTGRAYIFSGKNGERLLTLNGENKEDGFGPGRGVGDVNGDGFDDLFVAAYTNSEGATYAGKTYLISGKNGSILRTMTSTQEFHGFGVDAIGMGDVNEDNQTDFLVTAVGEDFLGLDVGYVYCIAGIP